MLQLSLGTDRIKLRSKIIGCSDRSQPSSLTLCEPPASRIFSQLLTNCWLTADAAGSTPSLLLSYLSHLQCKHRNRSAIHPFYWKCNTLEGVRVPITYRSGRYWSGVGTARSASVPS
jgi:hypothetical protein